MSRCTTKEKIKDILNIFGLTGYKLLPDQIHSFEIFGVDLKEKVIEKKVENKKKKK